MKKFIEICGDVPINFKFSIPSGNDYIFIPDPNFLPLNLYKFYKNVVTVNSFEECYYYVSLGWEEINIISSGLILDYGLFLTFFSLLLLLILKKRIFVINILKQYKKYVNLFLKSKISILAFLLIELFFVIFFVIKKSISIPNFIDEYVVLTSNFNFYTKLNFSAGDFLGGSYSVYLTSGPISAVGSVIGWSLSKDFVYSRIFNFFWIFFLNLFLFNLTKKNKEYSKLYTLFLTLPIFLLIPWWQGMLYGLGEIASMILFSNSIFIFSKKRHLAMSLFSIAIFYGKFLTLLPFLGFYIIVLIKEKKSKLFLKDLLYFIFPIIPWLALLSLHYTSGGLVNYINDFSNIIFSTNSASGINQISNLSVNQFLQSLNNTEYINWNVYEKLRIIFLPILTIFLLLKLQKNENNIFSNLALPIVVSILLPYLWFWFISPLKWIRYSHHFMVLVLVILIYVLTHNLALTKFEYTATFIMILSFLDNKEKLILMLLPIVVSLIIFSNKINWLKTLKISLIFLILLDISFSFFQTPNLKVKEIKYDSCTQNLTTTQCRQDYLNN